MFNYYLLAITYYYFFFNFKDNFDITVDEPANNIEEPAVVNENVQNINGDNLFGNYIRHTCILCTMYST